MAGWKWFCLLGLLLVGGAGIYFYDVHSARYPSTENAYIDATAIEISTPVSGRVASVSVSSQQAVEEGDVLLTLDPVPYRAALKKAEANLALAQRRVVEHEAALAAAVAGVGDARVKLNNAERHWQRLQQTSSFVSADVLEEARAAYERAQSNLEVMIARRDQARARLQRVDGHDGLIDEAEASVEQARWELAQATVTAPCEGTAEDVGVNPGEAVSANRPLFVLICNREYWVRANFKETELGRIRPGQPVTIGVDMYPERVFHGVVVSISPASGTAFSMLPPENATGNWVKVTQRVPVRIRVTDVDGNRPLRIGTSAHVTIDTSALDG